MGLTQPMVFKPSPWFLNPAHGFNRGITNLTQHTNHFNGLKYTQFPSPRLKTVELQKTNNTQTILMVYKIIHNKNQTNTLCRIH
ncbi:MAG: hypothetical protein EAY66_05605 [Sphingobacteriales bacterium]|nr:MAG: hypothetical protein EAY66_05605 [Sphingobacteriales bacterium]